MTDYDFDLPPGQIAAAPARPRDSARLLHVGGSGDGHGADGLHPYSLTDLHVTDLPGLLAPGDVMVVNDTRVIPAQLDARRGAARIGVTLDQPRPDGTWHALVRNARRLRPGDTLDFDRAPGLQAIVLACADGAATVRFNLDGAAFQAALQQAGALALPPYIPRPTGPTPADATDYQTIFAQHDGAVAAPTAALHFTPALLARLPVPVTVTLHVGAGTFLPMRDGPADHVMHRERGVITAAAAEAINAARRVVAVGTTTLRLLESAAGPHGVTPFEGDTALFIQPGFSFRVVSRLMTNFHLPRSTLFMLVCAFAGAERMRAAYAHAIGAGYRFYSYGDSSLLERP